MGLFAWRVGFGIFRLIKNLDQVIFNDPKKKTKKRCEYSIYFLVSFEPIIFTFSCYDKSVNILIFR
jgi:hypothetical protein